jgi:hypothetical protein
VSTPLSPPLPHPHIPKPHLFTHPGASSLYPSHPLPPCPYLGTSLPFLTLHLKNVDRFVMVRMMMKVMVVIVMMISIMMLQMIMIMMIIMIMMMVIVMMVVTMMTMELPQVEIDIETTDGKARTLQTSNNQVCKPQHFSLLSLLCPAFSLIFPLRYALGSRHSALLSCTKYRVLVLITSPFFRSPDRV